MVLHTDSLDLHWVSYSVIEYMNKPIPSTSSSNFLNSGMGAASQSHLSNPQCQLCYLIFKGWLRRENKARFNSAMGTPLWWESDIELSHEITMLCQINCLARSLKILFETYFRCVFEQYGYSSQDCICVSLFVFPCFCVENINREV